MKKIITSIVTTLAIASGIAQNGAVFEYKLSSKGESAGTNKVYVSDKGSRIETSMPMTNGSSGLSFVNIVKKEKPSIMYKLNEKNKTYSKQNISSDPNNNKQCDNCVVTIMGKEKVGNYNCTHASIAKGPEVIEYWTTTEIADFDKYSKDFSGSKYMGSGSDYGALVKKGAGGFVVKTYTKNGPTGDITMELVKFEKKDVAATLFDIPADYKETNAAPMH